MPDDKPTRVDSALACVAKCRAHDGAATALFYAKGASRLVLFTSMVCGVRACVHPVCEIGSGCAADASVNPGLCSCRTEACAHDTVRFPHTAETKMGEEGGEYGHAVIWPFS